MYQDPAGQVTIMKEKDDNSFSSFMKDAIEKHGMTQQEVFVNADIPERYGYKLISGEKYTKQRDIIIRICYSAGLSLQETQRALKKYGAPELNTKLSRDVILIKVFNRRPGSIIDVNIILRENGLDPLSTSGVHE